MKYLLSILLFFSVSQINAQRTPRRLIGLDPVTGKPGYIWKDTLTTYYYHTPLYTVGDTVYIDTSSFSGGGGQWTKIGDNIRNSNTGKVGINTDTAHAQFEVVTPTNTTQLIDSTGITLSTPFAATNALYKSPGPIVFKAKGWNTTTSASQDETFRMGVFGALGAGGALPSFYFQGSKDGVTYSNVFHTSGTTTIFDAAIQGTSGTFSSTLTSAGVFSTSNNMFSNSTTGQTFIGKSPTSFPSEPSAIAAFYSNSKQGVLLPVLTTAQRDSIGWTVSAVSITNGGSGYTSAPNITNTQTYLNSSAPVTNGVLDWGGNYFVGTATISGGAVTGVSVSRGGYFNGAVKINFVGGGGTGAAATATMSRLLPNGLTIYCSDCTATDSSTGVTQTWNGTDWKNYW